MGKDQQVLTSTFFCFLHLQSVEHISMDAEVTCVEPLQRGTICRSAKKFAIFTETLRFTYETVIFRKSGFNSLTMRSTLKFEKT